MVSLFGFFARKKPTTTAITSAPNLRDADARPSDDTTLLLDIVMAAQASPEVEETVMDYVVARRVERAKRLQRIADMMPEGTQRDFLRAHGLRSANAQARI